MSSWLKWMLLGLLSVALGLFALGNSVVATLAVTSVTGIALLVSGSVQLLGSLSATEAIGSRIFGGLLGLLMGFLGINFLFKPLEGAVSLTMLIMIVLASSGILRIAFSWNMRETSFFWPMLLSGALSILLAGYIWVNFALASLSLLGILLGIELLLNGIGLMILALAMRNQSPD